MAAVDRKLEVKDLSPDQRLVYDNVEDWVSGNAASLGHNGLLSVGGLAGTGKSTLVGVFASQTRLRVAYVAFTGRAASVLERKLKACGVRTTSKPYLDPDKLGKSRFAHLFSTDPGATYCGTIHRLLYKPVVNEKDELIGFNKRDTLDRAYDLVVVDEASMVSDEMLADLKRHGVPILAVGDHGQLPPVQATGSVVQNPDLRLERIHRQAAGNPIIALAHHIREGGLIRDFPVKKTGDQVRVISKAAFKEEIKTLRLEEMMETGLICWMNKTRVRLNSDVRRALGIDGLPKKGEVCICLKNMPACSVFNGMRGVFEENVSGDPGDEEEVFSSSDDWILPASISFPDEGLPKQRFRMCAFQFNRERTLNAIEELAEFDVHVKSMKQAGDLFDFGYAITAHKSQGSSWKHVYVYGDKAEDPRNEDSRRWWYTSASRSSERLTIVL